MEVGRALAKSKSLEELFAYILGLKKAYQKSIKSLNDLNFEKPALKRKEKNEVGWASELLSGNKN